MFSRTTNYKPRPAWARYGVAVGSVILGWLAREALTPAVGQTGLPFLFFFPAAAMAAWYGGFGPGALATLLGATAANWFFIEPLHAGSVGRVGDVVALAAFLISCLFVVSAMEAMHRARLRALLELTERQRVEAELARVREQFAMTVGSIGRVAVAPTAPGSGPLLNKDANCVNQATGFIDLDSHAVRLSVFGFATYALLGGGITLVGWFAGLPRLTDWDGNGIAMLPNAASAAVCSGAAMILAVLNRRWCAGVSGILGLVVLLLGGATLFEHLSGIDLGIDGMLVKATWGKAAVAPGRMGPPASISYTLVGLALLLIATTRDRARRIVPTLGVIVSAIAMLALMGYVSGADPLFAVAKYTGVAMQTATVLLALALGILASVPECEPVRTLRSNNAAGLLARRSLPFIVALPLVLGWLRIRAQQAGWFDTAMGTALLTLILIAIFCGLLSWWAGGMAKYEKELAGARDLLATTLASIGDAVIATDTEGRVLFLNLEAESLTGWKSSEAAGRPSSEIFRIINEQARTTVENPVEKVLRLGTVVGMANYTLLIAKDGREIPIDDSAAPIRQSDGPLFGVVLVFRNIAEQRQREQRVNEQAALLDLSTDAIFARDAQNRITYWSKGAEEAYGYGREEALGQTTHGLLQTIFPEPLERIDETLRRDGRWAGELMHTRKSGSKMVDDSRWVLKRDADGNPVSVLETNNDITERKRAEESLRESQERLLRLVNSAMDAIVAVDAEQRITMFNPAAEQMFGCRAEEAVGGPLERFIPMRFREAHRGHVEKFGQTGVTGRRMGALMTLSGLRTNGEEFPIEASISHVEVGGQKAFKVILRDITERKQAESRLSASHAVTRILAESPALGSAIPAVLQTIGERLGWDVGDMWILDSESKVLRCLNVWHTPSVNIEAFKTTSCATTFSTGSSLPGRVWASMKPMCISDVENDVGFLRVQEAAAVGLRSGFAFPVAAGDKFLGVMEFFCREVRQPDDALLQTFVGVGSQIGQFIERKRVEEALSDAHEQLASRAVHLEKLVEQRTSKLNETIGDLETFSYSIVHDMRAPLRAMSNFARLLAEECGPVNATAKDYVRRITTASERMDRLIQEVLNYSRVARPDLPLNSLDAGALLRGMVATYPSFQPPAAEIEMDGEFPFVRANEAALTQCFSNLLGNAVKFVEPGVIPHVRVWAETHADRVRLFFHDNGIGIDKDAHEKIFQMFQRLSKRFEGTGIGLTIVKKAIEKMGGRVGLESEPGAGSTFWLDLARANESQQGDAPQ
jgi:PAS domain S-box-containing protein